MRNERPPAIDVGRTCPFESEQLACAKGRLISLSMLACFGLLLRFYRLRFYTFAPSRLTKVCVAAVSFIKKNEASLHLCLSMKTDQRLSKFQNRMWPHGGIQDMNPAENTAFGNISPFFSQEYRYFLIRK